MMGLKGFKPHGDFVVIELCEKKTTTEAGIIYESKTKTPFLKGRVLSIGAGEKDSKGNIFPAHFNIDDYVLFDTRNGVESYDGLVLVKIQSVIAVVDKDTEIS